MRPALIIRTMSSEDMFIWFIPWRQQAIGPIIAASLSETLAGIWNAGELGNTTYSAKTTDLVTPMASHLW